MNLVEEIKLYLPKWLSADTEKEFYKCITQFPKELDDKSFYTEELVNDENLFQGDGIRDLLYVNLPSEKIDKVSGVVLSNTCDVSLANERKFFAPRIVYSPIINMERYRTSLLKRLSQGEVDGHILSVRSQRITQIFYLPGRDGVLEESLVFLDRVCSCKNSEIHREGLKDQRLFTLSDFGAYLFLMKLSMHFSRIQDKVQRGSICSKDC